TPVTASDEENKGIAEVPLRFEESEQNNLDPFITITLPAEHRTVPAEAPEAQRFQLPEEWCDRRRRSLPQLLAHTSRENPAEVIVGFPAQLELAYVDFHRSGLRNPLALPEDTLQVHLADVDVCFDDTMTGFGMAADPESRDRRVVAVGEDEDEYPYLDVWPTAPEAMGDLPERPDAFLDSPRGWIEPPRSWLDPPGAPVGMLGGAGFEQTGPLTVDGRGFVFMLDGRRIRRFYPDGTLCETVEVRGALPVGLAADPAGNLFVAAGLRGVIMFRRDDDGYLHRVDRVLSTWTILPDDPLSAAPVVSFSVRNAQGVAVSDGLLLVADADGRSVWVFSIAGFSDEAFGHQGTMQRSTTGTELFQRPVAVAMDRQGRLYVGDDQGHKVLCLTLVWDAGGNLLGEQIWVHAGGAEFSPEAIAVDGKNQIVYALEAGGRPILRLDAGSGDPLPSWTPMPAPNAVAVDPRGEVYVAGGEEPQVRRFTFFQADGTVLADRAEPRPAGDPWLPAPAEQHMSRPGYVVFDSEGRLWVSDTGNDRVLMFQRNAAGELERSRILSEGLDRPAGVVRGPEGELFVAEAHRVRRYDASLSASEVFDATFQDSAGLAIGRRDGELRLYVADKGRNQVAVLGLDGSSFDPITTDGTTAFSEPEDVAVDSRHNLYVADTGNQRLVCFPAASGGTPRAIVVSAHDLSFSQPCGVSVDDEDRLLVTDRERNTVFRLTTDGTLLEFWDLECLVQHSLSWAYQAPIDGTVR
ncbi:MAG: hypothetical protein GY856_37530, partial [bacterium]|nr:hypothetical protein [bacterium]